MNDALSCTLHTDTLLLHDALAALVAEITDGRAHLGTVRTAWAVIGIGDDAGDLDDRRRDPDNFVHWAMYTDITPVDGVGLDEVVAHVRHLAGALRARGMRVVAAGDLVDIVGDDAI